MNDSQEEGFWELQYSSCDKKYTKTKESAQLVWVEMKNVKK